MTAGPVILFVTIFSVFSEHRGPVFVVVGAEGVDAEGLGDFAVAGAVVDEEGLVGGGLLALEHHLEDGRRGLHQAALVTEVEVVEVVVDGVVAAIKVEGQVYQQVPCHFLACGLSPLPGDFEIRLCESFVQFFKRLYPFHNLFSALGCKDNAFPRISQIV